jgi:hypothetical protein
MAVLATPGAALQKQNRGQLTGIIDRRKWCNTTDID